MSTSALTPQQIAQFKLFNPSPNPLFQTPDASQPAPAAPTPPPSGSIASAMAPAMSPSSAPTSASPSPTAPSSGASLLYGSPTAKPPLSQQDFAQQNPDATKAYMPTRPINEMEFPNSNHPTMMRALQSLFAGMAEFGRPGAGFEMANRWAGEEQAQRQYDNPANQERMKAGALNQSYQNYLSQQQGQAGIEHEQAETQNVAQNIPIQEQAQKLHDSLVQRWQSHVDPDEQTFRQYAAEQLQSAPGRSGAMVAPHLDAITKLPQQQPQFKITGGTIEPLTYAGHSYGLQASPGEPPEVTAARQSAIGSLQQGELAKLDPIIRGQLGEPPIDGKVTPAQQKMGIRDMPTYMAKAEKIKTRMAAAPRVEAVMMRPTQVADTSGNVHYETAGNAIKEGGLAPTSANVATQKHLQEAYTSGPQAAQLTAINTAREHMKTFQALADALDNGNVQVLNRIGNEYGIQFGNDKATNFKIAAQAFGGEVGKAFDGAGVTEGERKSAQGAFNPNMSPQQFRGAIQTVDSLLAGKQKSLQSSYESGRQGKPNFGGSETGRTQQAPAGATHIVPGPDGKNHYTNAQGTVDLGIAP